MPELSIFKIEFHDRSPEIVTAQSTENVTARSFGGKVKSVRNYGPYLSDGAYQALRDELL